MMRINLLICVVLLACGCASKTKPPSPKIQSEITARLGAYSNGWFAGDERAVAQSFVQRNAEEREFALSLGRLAAVQKELLNEQHAVPEVIAATVQMSDTTPMVTLNRPWHYYAYAASNPPQGMLMQDEAVVVEMIKSGDYTLSLRDVGGQWLIEPQGWAKDRPVSVLTDSIRRQIALTTSATAAIRAKEWERLRVVLQQMHQQRMVDKISDSTNLNIP
jgi:hypothetical protein